MKTQPSSFEVLPALDERSRQPDRAKDDTPTDTAEKGSPPKVIPPMQGFSASSSINQAPEERAECRSSECGDSQLSYAIPEPISSLLTAILVNTSASIRFLSSQPDCHPSAILCVKRVLRDATELAAQLKSISAHASVSAGPK